MGQAWTWRSLLEAVCSHWAGIFCQNGQKDNDMKSLRGALRYQIRSFFEHRSKGGGVISMFKNFGANFV